MVHSTNGQQGIGELDWLVCNAIVGLWVWYLTRMFVIPVLPVDCCS